jgi:hypothetical protein
LTFFYQGEIVMEYTEDVGYRAEPHTHLANELRPLEDAFEYLRAYARERPEVMALACFGIGFVLGWKLKPW